MNTGELFPIDKIYRPEAWGSGVADVTPKVDKETTALVEANTEYPPRVRIIGNLPFNISTPLLISWLDNISNRRQIWRLGRVPMTLTFQKEVCERLVAEIWDEQRSRLSVMSQMYCEVSCYFLSFSSH